MPETPPASESDEKLIHFPLLIARAKKVGVSFGKGNPYNRLRYYTKIGLLPKASRKSFLGGYPAGAYPESVLSILVEIDNKLKAGKSVQAILREQKKKDVQPEQKIASSVTLMPVLTQKPERPTIKIPDVRSEMSETQTQTPISTQNLDSENQVSETQNPTPSTLHPTPHTQSDLIWFARTLYSKGRVALAAAAIFFLLIPNAVFLYNQLHQEKIDFNLVASNDLGSLELNRGSGLVLGAGTSPYLYFNVETDINALVHAKKGVAFSSSSFEGVLNSGSLTANRAYSLPDADGTLCLTTGNCAGAGGGVTVGNGGAGGGGGSGNGNITGTINRLAKFTGPQSIGDSIISDDGSLVTVAGNLTATGNINGNNLTASGNVNGVNLSASGTLSVGLLAIASANFLCHNGPTLSNCSLPGTGDITDVGDVSSGPAFTSGVGSSGSRLYFHNSGFEGLLTVGSLTGPQTYTLPDASGTVCVSGFTCASNGVVGYWTRTTGGLLSPSTPADLLAITPTLTTVDKQGFNNTIILDGSAATDTYYGSKLLLTNTKTTNPDTIYGQYITFTDTGSLANTLTGLYVDASTANTNDTTYSALFLGGRVGISTTTPTALLDVRTNETSGNLLQVAAPSGPAIVLTGLTNGINVDLSNFDALTNSVNRVGFNVAALPIATGVTGDTGFKVGSGWDFGFDVSSKSIVRYDLRQNTNEAELTVSNTFTTPDLITAPNENYVHNLLDIQPTIYSPSFSGGVSVSDHNANNANSYLNAIKIDSVIADPELKQVGLRIGTGWKNAILINQNEDNTDTTSTRIKSIADPIIGIRGYYDKGLDYSGPPIPLCPSGSCNFASTYGLDYSPTVNINATNCGFCSDVIFNGGPTYNINGSGVDIPANLLTMWSRPNYVITSQPGGTGGHLIGDIVDFTSGYNFQVQDKTNDSLSVRSITQFAAGGSSVFFGGFGVTSKVTVNNIYGLAVADAAPVNNGGGPGATGVVNNQYGVYIQNLNGASVNNYGVYLDGAKSAALYAKAGITNDTPTVAKLDNTQAVFTGDYLDIQQQGDPIEYALRGDQVSPPAALDPDHGATSGDNDANTVGGTAYSLVTSTSDAFYLGNSSTFNSLQVDIVTASTGATLVWEYCSGVNGSNQCNSWSNLVSCFFVCPVNDGTAGFTTDGEVTWGIPGNWVQGKVGASNSVYWVRVRATALTSGATANYSTPSITTGGNAIKFSRDTNNAFVLDYRGNANLTPFDPNVDALDIGLQTATAGTTNGISITPGSSNSGTLRGISIGDIATPGAASETAMRVGSGWDTGVNLTSVTSGGTGITATLAAATASTTGISVTGSTCTACGTINLNTVSVPNSAITTSGTINGFNFADVTTGPATGSLRAVNIGSITTPGAAANETAVIIGTGWDNSIRGLGTLRLASSLTSGNAVTVGNGNTNALVILSSAYTGLNIDLQTNYTVGSNTRTAFSIAGMTGASGSGGITGIDIGAITTPNAGGAETAVSIGAGWDNGILFTGAVTNNITTSAGVALSIDTGTTGAINIGTTGGPKTISIGSGGAANTITIGSGSATGVSITDNNWSINTSGLITTADDIAINGGDITTTSGTFNLINANATNVHFAEAGTTISIGAGTGITTVNNGLTVTGTLTGNGPVSLDPAGAGDVNIATAFGSGSYLNITGLDTQSGTSLCVDTITNNVIKCSTGSSSGTLQSAYDNSTSSPQIVLNTSPGAGKFAIKDNATPLVGNLFEIQDNAGAVELGVSATSVTINNLTPAAGSGLCVGALNVIFTCTAGSSSATLQSAYGAGNTIDTTTARNIAFTLADTATDSAFVVNLNCATGVSCSGGTNDGDFVVQDEGTTFAAFRDDGSITLGKALAASTINIGTGTAADTIHIGDGGTGADAITIGTTGSVAIAGTVASSWNVTGANLTLSTTTSGTLAATSAGALNLTGNLASTFKTVSSNLDIKTETSGTLAISSAGALNLTGLAASTWQNSGGALTIQTTSQNLTLQTVTGGTLAVTSAGALNLTSGAASNIGVNPGTTGDVVFTHGDGSQTQLTATETSDNTINIVDISLTDNAGASTGTLYGLAVTNADNGANTGVPDSIAYIKNGNAADTVPAGLLIEQTGAGTLSAGLEIKRTAGTIIDALKLTGTFGTNLINATNFTVTSAGTVTIAANQSYTGSGAVTLSSAAATALTITGNAASTWSTSAGTLSINAGATSLNLQADGGAIDVNLAGGSGATGCTVENSTGNLTCTGNIGGSSGGSVGYWKRGTASPSCGGSTVICPATANDVVSITSSTGVPLTLTNTSAGNSLLVEDQASDPSPFVIDASGNVGIGTTTPNQLLHLSSAANTAIQFTTTATTGLGGPNSGTTFANDATVGTVDWTNPSGAQTHSDSSDATVSCLSCFSHYLKATGFSFSIPTGATITGIVVEIERKQNPCCALSPENSIKLVKGGTISGSEKATGTIWPGSYAYYSYGGGSDLWGLTLTPGDINASNFGVVISVNSVFGVTLLIDHIRITVYYGNTNWVAGIDTSASGNFTLSNSSAFGTNNYLVVNTAGQLALPTTGSAGGLLLGGDANLYRSATDILKTDDSLQVFSVLGVGSTSSINPGVLIWDAGNVTQTIFGQTYGMYVAPNLIDAHISNLGIFIANPTVSGAGAVTNNYGLQIQDQTTGSTNNYQIYSAGPGSQDGFWVKNIATNFGALATAGAFVGRNSYWGEEFNVFRTAWAAGITTTINDDRCRGDQGSSLTLTICTTAGVGELSYSAVLGVGASGNLCNALSSTTANGFETIRATSSATGSNTAACLEYIGAGAAAANKPFLANNLPVVTMKVRPSLVNSGSNARFWVGLGDKAVAAGGAMPNNGIFFTNCTTFTGSTCTSTVWEGTVTVGGAIVASQQACTAGAETGTINTTNFNYLRIEVRSNTNIHFYVDTDTSTGIIETECGTGFTGTGPAATALGINLESAFMTNSATTENLDVDYVRVWQDDAPVSVDQSGSMTTTQPDTNIPPISAAADPVIGSDIAENYEAVDPSLLTAGSLVSLDAAGKAILSAGPYDPKLLGVISTSPYQTLGNAANAVRVALTGRVPVKVSSENGAITAGDPLTSSSTPGVAMKATMAGPIVGKALENYDNPDKTVVGTVMVMISNSWYVPTSLITTGTASQYGDVNLGKLTASSVTTAVLFIGSHKFSINASGQLAIDGNIQIAGDLDVAGILTAKEVTTEKVNIKTASASATQASNASAGKAILAAGTTELTIQTSRVTADSLIFVTPATKTDKVLSVTQKVAGQSFKVEVTNPPETDIEFNWWVVN